MVVIPTQKQTALAERGQNTSLNRSGNVYVTRLLMHLRTSCQFIYLSKGMLLLNGFKTYALCMYLGYAKDLQKRNVILIKHVKYLTGRINPGHRLYFLYHIDKTIRQAKFIQLLFANKRNSVFFSLFEKKK